MGKNKDKFDFNGSNIIGYIVKRYKILFGLSLLAAIITAVASLFINDVFVSEIIISPSRIASSSQIISEINNSSGASMLTIGNEEDLDALMQVLNSNDILRQLAIKYNLMSYYKIDSTGKGAKHKLFSTLGSNISIAKNEYNSAVVKVWDTDPKMACNLAASIGSFVDSVLTQMEKQRVQEVFSIVSNELDSLTKRLKVLEDSVHKFNKLGIIDINPQMAELTKAYYKALTKGKQDVAKIAKKQLIVMEENTAKYSILRDEVVYLQRKQADMGVKLSMARMELNKSIPRKFIISQPQVSDYKDKPKRSIIVLVALLATFCLSLMGYIVVENFKRV